MPVIVIVIGALLTFPACLPIQAFIHAFPHNVGVHATLTLVFTALALALLFSMSHLVLDGVVLSYELFVVAPSLLSFIVACVAYIEAATKE